MAARQPQLRFVGTLVTHATRAPASPVVVGSHQFGLRVAQHAWTMKAWALVVERNKHRAHTYFAIADPNGRTAIWWTSMPADAANAVYYLTRNACLAPYFANLGPPTDRYAVEAFARAAARVLHAQVFGYTPNARDVLVAPYAQRRMRPPTRVVLAASRAILEAADLLYSADVSDEAPSASNAMRLILDHTDDPEEWERT